MDRSTQWVPISHLPGYEGRVNSNGYWETRPVETKTSQDDQGFEKWWDDQIRFAQIFLGSGDYWVSKGIAKKAWIAAKAEGK